MKLYFTGCSFTYGDELVDPQKSAWPTLVSQKLNFSFLNDAVSGGTNDRNVYKTMLNINDFDCFFIAWTSCTRFTEYNPVDNFEINFNPSLNLDASLHLSDDLKKNYFKYKQYGELYYTHWYNELFEFKKWLQQIIMLQSVLKTLGKKYVMMNTFCNSLTKWTQPPETFINSVRPLIDFFDYLNDDQLLQEQSQIQKMISLIDTETFVGWNNWTLTSMSLLYPKGENGHILEEGHQAVANMVLDHYYNKIL